MSSSKKATLKYYLLVSMLLTGHIALCQNMFLSLFGGSSNYSGDLQEKRFSFSQSNLAAGVGLLYEINPKMFIRGDFAFGKISAHDKYGKNKSRNLSFYSHLYDFSLGFEYVLFDPYIYRVSPYFFTGISLFDFSPHTTDASGNDILLAERNTEGQGFFEDRKDYKLRDYAIPLGGGILWSITDNKRLGFVVGFRKTFNDYLDDVSTTYIDEGLLALNRGQSTASIAYRGDELSNGGPYPVAGTPRGNPKSKDWYYFMGFTLRVRVVPKGRAIRFQYDTGKRRKARIDCPKVF